MKQYPNIDAIIEDSDTKVQDLAKVIGYGINLALHTGLTIGDVELFLS